MKIAFKSLAESILIFALGALAVTAASQHHWTADALFVFTALVIAGNSFLNYRLDYRIAPPTGTVLRRPEHYAIELLKSFMLFTCGEGVLFEFTQGDILVGSMFLLCAALICALVFDRDTKTARRLAS